MLRPGQFRRSGLGRGRLVWEEDEVDVMVFFGGLRQGRSVCVDEEEVEQGDG